MADVLAELLGLFTWEVDDKELTDAEKKAKEAAGKVAEKWKAAAGSITSSFAIVGAAIGGAVTGMFALVDSVSAAAVQTDNWAKRTGVASRELQRLQHAGKATGAEVDNVNQAVKTMRQGLGELERTGAGPASEALKTLGLSLDDIGRLGAEDQMAMLAEAFGKLPNQAQRVSVAMQLMGEDGLALLPLFEQGAAGIKKFGDEAERMGVVKTPEMIESSREFQATLAALKDEFAGFVEQIVGDGMPAIRGFVADVRAWVGENREVLRQKIAEFFDRVVKAAKDLAPLLASLAKLAGDLAGVIVTLTKALGPTGMIAALTGARLAVTALSSGFAGMLPHIAAVTAAVIAGSAAINAFADAKIRALEENQIRGTKEGTAAALRAAQYMTDEEITQAAGGKVTDPELLRFMRERREKGDAQQRNAAQRAESEAAKEKRMKRQLSTAQLRVLARQGDTEAAAALRERGEDKPAEGKKGGGGGGMSRADKAALARGTEEFGEYLGAIARSSGATDKALQAALLAAGQQLEKGTSVDVARGAGVSQLQSMTGDRSSNRSTNDLLLEAVGLTPGKPATPGAPSPVTGASFVRVDNSFTAPTTITIEIDAADVADFNSQEFADAVAAKVGEAIDTRNKQLYDRTRMQTVP